MGRNCGIPGLLLLLVSFLASSSLADDDTQWSVAELCNGPQTKILRPEPPRPPVYPITAEFRPCVKVANVSARFMGGGTITSPQKMRFARVRFIGPFLDHEISHVVLSDGNGNSVSRFVDNSNVSSILELESEEGTNTFTLSASLPIRIFEVAAGLKPDCDDFTDPDGDGLPTAWEVCGLKKEFPGGDKPTICRYLPCDLDLKAMGADPELPDIFVEIDWMGRGFHGRSHRPSPRGIRMIVDAFRARGISLHLDAGPKSEMDPFTGKRWGSMSESNRVIHWTQLGCCDVINACGAESLTIFEEREDCTNLSVDEIKNRPNGEKLNFEILRRAAFHYGVIAHRIDLGNRVAGMSRQKPGSDFVVAMGGWNPQTGTGGVLQQAGFLMHVLGHNLGLSHGTKFQIFTDFKPNYLSVMNNMFSTSGIIRGGGTEVVLDYSNFQLSGLNEEGLDERNGIGGAEVAGYFTKWTCPMGFAGECSGEPRQLCDTNAGCISPDVCVPRPDPKTRRAPADQPINWNCNLFGLEVPVEVDLNRDFDKRILSISQDDWLELKYDGGNIGNAQCRAFVDCDPEETLVLGIPGGLPEPEFLTPEIAASFGLPIRALVLPPEDRSVLPDSTTNLVFHVVNDGDVADTYDLSSVGDSDWFDTTSVPATLELDPGASAEIPIDVTPPPGTEFGAFREISLTATSQADPLAHSTGDVRVDVFSCGDANVDSGVDEGDVALLRLNRTPDPLGALSAVGMERCSVIGTAEDCDLVDIVVLRRFLAQAALPPGIEQICSAAGSPL